jgi:hypothetical protein
MPAYQEQSPDSNPSTTKKEKNYLARHQWLIPIATPEAKIRRIVVRSQPGQTVLKTLSQKYSSHTKKGLV